MTRLRRTTALLALLGCLVVGVPLAAPARADGVGLDVVVSGPSTATVGDVTTFTVTVTNTSGLDAGLVHVSVSAAGTLTGLSSAGAACTVADADCDADHLVAGAALVVDVTVRQDYAGSFSVGADAYGSTTTGDELGSGSSQLGFLVAPAPTALTLVVTPAVAVAGSQVTLTATLTTGGQPVDGAPVAFSRTIGGTTAEVGTSTTAATGIATMTDVAADTATYTATFTGDTERSGSAASAGLAVRLGVAVRVSPTTVPPGAPLSVVATVTPVTPGARVSVQQRIGHGAWRLISRPPLDARGTAAVSLRVGSRTGTWSYRVLAPTDGVRQEGQGSGVVAVTVRGKGSARAWVPESGTRSAPVRWNPCAPISYLVNTRLAPRTGLADLKEALRRVTMASGLRFRPAGRTSAVPQGIFGNTRAGTLLVAWTVPRATKGFMPEGVAGYGGYLGTGRRITSGSVAIDARWAKNASPGFGGGSTEGGVLMHEIGHAIGLGHVTDPWAIMQPVIDLPAAVWGAGDLAGLRAVGRAHGCLAG